MAKKYAGPLFLASAIALALGLAVAGWYLEREYNFRYGYSARARDIVKEMVKPECLR